MTAAVGWGTPRPHYNYDQSHAAGPIDSLADFQGNHTAAKTTDCAPSGVTLI